MWWLYFDIGAERAARQLAQDKDPGRMARLAYTYFHIPIVAGIIVTAASDEMAVAHPGGHAEPAAIAALLGGPALYLFGNLIFKRTSARYYPALAHGRARPARGAGLPFARLLSPLALSLAATGDSGAGRRLGAGVAARDPDRAQGLIASQTVAAPQSGYGPSAALICSTVPLGVRPRRVAGPLSPIASAPRVR